MRVDGVEKKQNSEVSDYEKNQVVLVLENQGFGSWKDLLRVSVFYVFGFI